MSIPSLWCARTSAWSALCLGIALLLPSHAAAGPKKPAVRELRGHTDLVRWVSFSPNGRQLVSSGFDGRIHVWSLKSGNIRTTLEQPGNRAYWAEFTPDGKTLASGYEDGTVRLWRTPAGKLRKTLRAHRAAAWSGCLSPDGKTMATADSAGIVRIWDVRSGQAKDVLHEGSDQRFGITYSPDGTLLACGGEGAAVLVWNVRSGELVRTIPHPGRAYQTAFSPDGKMLATGAQGTNAVLLWDVESGESKGELLAHGATVLELAISADGTTLVSGDEAGLIIVWDLTTRTVKKVLAGHHKAVWSVAISPDGHTVASGGEDRIVRLWRWQEVDHARIAHLGRADLRPEFARLALPPRRQGRRNTCSVFVVAGAFEYALSRARETSSPVSVEYLNWACNQVIDNQTADRGQFFHHLLEGIERHGFCLDDLMPYRPAFDPSARPLEKAKKNARENAALGFVVHWINPWTEKPGLTDIHVEKIKSVLAKGWPVAAGSSHSVLLVGFEQDADELGGGVFYTRDSGSGAYGRLSFAHAKGACADVFWVEAPGLETPEDRPPRGD